MIPRRLSFSCQRAAPFVRLARVLGFLVVPPLFGSFAAPQSDSADPAVIVGVNVVGVAQASEKKRDALLDQLQRYGVKTIRTALGGHNEGYTTFIIKASQRGIGSVVFIGPSQGGANKHALPADKSFGRRWPLPVLSDADPEEFRKWFTDELATLEAAGVRATAFELGNELNLSYWNGDFLPQKLSPGILRLTDLENPHDSEEKNVATGYRAYIKVLGVLKDLRDHSKLNRTTPILSGMSAGPLTGYHGVPILDSVEFLRRNGLDTLVDGYAVHYYPDASPRLPVSARVQLIEKDGELSACGPGSKPCWITEWGFPNGSQSCPINDAMRARVVQDERTAFKKFADQRRVAAIIYYSWSGGLPFFWEDPNKESEDNDPKAIFRCGALTDAGEAALDPM